MGVTMNQQTTTHAVSNRIPYRYALKMFLGWSILYMGTLVGFVELLRRNII